MIFNIGIRRQAISVEANLLQQVKSQRDGRSQNSLMRDCQYEPQHHDHGGGTGGHIFPALAVADVLRAEGWKVIWLGAPNSMEAELVPSMDTRWHGCVSQACAARNSAQADAAAESAGCAVQSAVAMFRHRPDVVLGMVAISLFPVA